MRAIPREVCDGYVSDAVHAYAIGLWCADGYWWSSSIGISNVEPELVVRFGHYLSTLLPPERLRLRVYVNEGAQPDDRVLELTDRVSLRPASKMKRTAYHLYVNSRPLLRRFLADRERLEEFPAKYLGSYFAGRFDGDGNLGITPRIAYTTRQEAMLDAALLQRAGIRQTSVLFYRKANEHCIYIKKADQRRFRSLIELYSWKAGRRITL